MNSYLQLQADMLKTRGSTIMEDTTTSLSTIELMGDDERAIQGLYIDIGYRKRAGHPSKKAKFWTVL